MQPSVNELTVNCAIDAIVELTVGPSMDVTVIAVAVLWMQPSVDVLTVNCAIDVTVELTVGASMDVTVIAVAV